MKEKIIEKEDMNKKTAQLSEMNPADFNFAEHPFIYQINKQSGEITLMKAGRELPIEINTQFDMFNSGSNKIVKPNWDTYELEWLIRYNHTHRRCMELKSTLIAGFGFDFRNKEHANFKKLEAWAKRPNTTFGDTLSKIAVKIKRQQGIYGYGPVLINKAFDTIQMFAATNTKSTFVMPNIRNGVNYSGVRKYVQLAKNSSQKQEFFPYDGNPKTGRNYMHWIGYKSLSNSYYPEPEYLPAKDKILEDIFVDKNNIDFFKNRAMGDFVIVFSGAPLDTKDKEKVKSGYKDNLSQFKGIGNQHKTMVLHSKGKDAKIQVVDLSKNEDGQYSVRQQMLESAIARAWGIMPSLISLTKNGSGFGGGSVAIGDLFLENQIMIRPEQRDFEEDINLILESLFGFDPMIKFRTIDTNNQKDMAIILSQVIGSGTPVAEAEARRYVHEHGIMEFNSPDIIPAKEDRVVPNSRMQTTLEGEINSGTDTGDEKDAATTIDENKFNDDK